jgi:hypothetical protein
MAKLLGLPIALITAVLACSLFGSDVRPSMTAPVTLDGEALTAAAPGMPSTLATARVAPHTGDPLVDGEQDAGDTHSRVPRAAAGTERTRGRPGPLRGDFFTRPDLPPRRGSIA